MIKQILILLTTCFLLSNCDIKKTSISGKVISKTTGAGIENALVSYIQCKSNGDNCTEVYIGQCYTNSSGEFIIDQKTASKSKTKWLTVHKNSQKLAQVDNIGLTDKNISIEVLP